MEFGGKFLYFVFCGIGDAGIVADLFGWFS
jgi:hypothetical protein